MKKIIKKVVKNSILLLCLISQTVKCDDPFSRFLKNIITLPTTYFSKSTVSFTVTLAIVSAAVKGSQYWSTKAEDKFLALKWLFDQVQKHPTFASVFAIMAAIAYTHNIPEKKEPSNKPKESAIQITYPVST